MKEVIYWFRNDLRLEDNPALTQALKEADQLIPVYILDERYLATDRWGFARTGPFRLQFLLESLHNLKRQLKKSGSGLMVRVGLPEQIIPALAKEFGLNTVYASAEYTAEEVRIEKRLGQQLELKLFHTTTLYHPKDLPFLLGDLPEMFTQFRKKVEKYVPVRPLCPKPEKVISPCLPETTIPELSTLGFPKPKSDTRQCIPFQGGASAANARLKHYFWGINAVATYKETRNGLIGADYSTKFSPWLANGCISPRTIIFEIDEYEAEREANQSTYWVKFELLWRDYFKFVAMKHGARIFQKGGIQNKVISPSQDLLQFKKWATGSTGDDFVDANMQELLCTGFMSNRGRQNVASYLVHQMNLDWRMGAAWFESLLVDYDVCSNYGNWMYAAGVGNDPRDRVFNTQKQAGMYDKDGSYRRLWLSGKD